MLAAFANACMCIDTVVNTFTSCNCFCHFAEELEKLSWDECSSREAHLGISLRSFHGYPSTSKHNAQARAIMIKRLTI